MSDSSYDDGATDLGSQFRVRRRALGLTQSEVADLAGVAQRTVSLLETGEADTRLDTAEAVASVLGLRIIAVSHDRAAGVLAAERLT